MPSGKDSPRIANAGGWRHICFRVAISLDAHDRTVLLALVLVAVARSLAIVMSPLELGVDEAQYWLWSTEFDFGYYTKPPLTSWIIGASHAVFGHHVWAVRLPRPGSILQPRCCCGGPVAGLAGRAGRWAALCGPAFRRSRSAVS